MPKTEFSTSVLCACGCGLPAPLAPQNRAKGGWIKGQPRKFRVGHVAKAAAPNWPARFWARVDKRAGPDGCWPWQGSHTPGKYGSHQRIEHGRVIVHTAHRVAYELGVGPIPEGYTIDHVKARGCTNLLCCNPAHLEAVPHGVNLLRGNTVNAANSVKTHCKHGHEFTAENTYIRPDTGCRQCRACRTAASARCYAHEKDIAK